MATSLGVVGYQQDRRRARNSRDPSPAVNAAPVAVARRNARERNRVKQVNNGFATLRQHIPTSVAASYESGAPSRGASKKLSKVETLRMAVDYIRRLEHLLALSDGTTTSGDASSSLLHHSSASLSPEEYSESSMSPGSHTDTKPFTSLLQFGADLGYDGDLAAAIKTELLSPGAPVGTHQEYILYSSTDDATSEQSDMMDVIWWDQEHQKS